MFFALLLSSNLLIAETEVEGEVSGVWTVEDSPYRIIGEISIPEEDTLAITRGVEVTVLSELSIIVHGVLIVTGNEDEIVVIHGDEGNESPWQRALVPPSRYMPATSLVIIAPFRAV